MDKSFLQSPEWGAFQAQVGGQPKIITNVQVLEYTTPVGKFWYLPHASGAEALIPEAKKQGVVFIRVEPVIASSLPASAVAVKNRQPQNTLILDLSKSLENLLADMHQKTRYNIRLAAKKNLKISWEKNPELFINLMKDTSARDKFGAHSPEYYQKMLDCKLVEQGTVFFENQPLASAIFIGYEKTYTYLHGASSNEHRDLMAPYLLQWSAITRAQTNGFTKYDFWGIAPDGADNHPLAGVTRFKLGFGGQQYEFGQAFEIPIKPFKYAIFNLLKKIRL